MLGSVAASFPPAAWLVHECEHTSIPGASKKGCAESDPSHNVLSVQGVAFTIGGVACGVRRAGDAAGLFPWGGHACCCIS